jgi:antitoxin HicB
MAIAQRKTLEEYLALEYPFEVKADPDGGYIVSFPDLPGCLTQADTLEELSAAVEEARALWLETAYDQGIEIPLPSYREECSGKILLRVPKSLHRRLLDQADREGVSLNQYAVSVLSRGDAQASVERRLEAIEQQLHYIHDRLQHYQVSMPGKQQTPRLEVVVGDTEPTRYAIAS